MDEQMLQQFDGKYKSCLSYKACILPYILWNLNFSWIVWVFSQSLPLPISGQSLSQDMWFGNHGY